MPIIIGGKQIEISDIQQAAEKAPAVETKQADKPMVETPKRVVFKSQQPKINDGNTLIVNGKKKTIGRKSQYLLDMMIIDDE